MDLRQYEIHKAIAGKQLEHDIFHENWTAEVIAQIRKMLADNTMPKVHWLAIPRDMKTIIKSGGEINFSQYWLQRAKRILTAYQNYEWPTMNDGRDIAGYETVNLLSEKGKDFLHTMNPHQAENAVRKSSFDISLMRDFSLDGFFEAKSLFKDNTHTSNIYPSIYPISGCYNKCVHCFIEAKTPMVSMPFPVYLKIMNMKESKYKRPFDQGDSEFLAYYDKVMEADFGDFYLWAQTIMNYTEWDVLAKGIIDNTVTALSLSKLLSIHSVNRRHARGSLVLCDGEDIDENIKRCKSMQDLFMLYNKPRENAIFAIGSSGQIHENMHKIKSIGANNIFVSAPSRNGRACRLSAENFIESETDLQGLFEKNGMKAFIINEKPMNWNKVYVDACGAVRLQSPKPNLPTTCGIIAQTSDIFGRPQAMAMDKIRQLKTAEIHR